MFEADTDWTTMAACLPSNGMMVASTSSGMVSGKNPGSPSRSGNSGNRSRTILAESSIRPSSITTEGSSTPGGTSPEEAESQQARELYAVDHGTHRPPLDPLPRTSVDGRERPETRRARARERQRAPRKPGPAKHRDGGTPPGPISIRRRRWRREALRPRRSPKQPGKASFALHGRATSGPEFSIHSSGPCYTGLRPARDGCA